MPFVSPEPNLIDPFNSTDQLLGGGGVFAGTFTDVLNFQSVSLAVNSDVASEFPGIEVQWSDDGIDVRQSQLFSYGGPIFTGAGFTPGITIHFPIRMRYYRIVYTNGFTPQTMFVLTSLLRRISPTGTIQRVGTNQVFATGTLDGQVALGVLVCQDYFNDQFVLPYATTEGVPIGGAYLIVDKPIASDFVRSTITPAALVNQVLDQGFGQSIRRFASIYNDSVRGTLFVKLGGPATLIDWHFKVPPRHTWRFPQAWGMSSAEVNGLWDVADGRSVYVEGGN